jgi:hypothetical protein
VWGLALGIASDAPGAYAADTAPAGMNASVMSSYRMLSDAGYVLGPLLLGLVAAAAGAPIALVLTGGLLYIAVVLFWRFAPETYRPGYTPDSPARELAFVNEGPAAPPH